MLVSGRDPLSSPRTSSIHHAGSDFAFLPVRVPAFRLSNNTDLSFFFSSSFFFFLLVTCVGAVGKRQRSVRGERKNENARLGRRNKTLHDLVVEKQFVHRSFQCDKTESVLVITYYLVVLPSDA